MRYDITALYYFIDEFCKIYEEWNEHRLLPSNHKRLRPTRMKLSEMLTIMILFHMSSHKVFKHFYIEHIAYTRKNDFPDLVDYDRFVALMPRLFVPLCMMLHLLKGDETSIYFMDSTHIPVCHNKRINRNRVFKGMAERGKNTMGWFFGFKLHLLINHKGEIVAVKISKGNVDDRVPVDKMTEKLFGFIVLDKGYIDAKLFHKLYKRGLKMIVGIKKGMKNMLVNTAEKLLLRKRFVIETVFSRLKAETNMIHTRHRSPVNAAINIISALVAYCFKTNKPKVKGLVIHS